MIESGGSATMGASVQRLTVIEAAAYLGVCPSVVYALVGARALPHYRIGQPGRRGKITISVAQEGSEIVIRFSDDGAGLNIEAIRSKAMERGLVARDASLTDEEMIQFILVAGFSTAAKVTSHSTVSSRTTHVQSAGRCGSARARVGRLRWLTTLTSRSIDSPGRAGYVHPFLIRDRIRRQEPCDGRKELAAPAARRRVAGARRGWLQ